jgi:hypothetical protein
MMERVLLDKIAARCQSTNILNIIETMCLVRVSAAQGHIRPGDRLPLFDQRQHLLKASDTRAWPGCQPNGNLGEHLVFLPLGNELMEFGQHDVCRDGISWRVAFWLIEDMHTPFAQLLQIFQEDRMRI